MSQYPQLKLSYWDVTGRGEAIRLALYLGNIPFEDDRVPFDAFDQVRPTLPYHQLPVLRINGKIYAQSQALLIYAGKLGGLYPMNDPIAGLQSEEIVFGIEDMGNAMSPSFFETDEKKKLAMRKELAETTIPRYLSQVNERLTKMQEYEPFTDTSIHIHDVYLYVQDRWLSKGVIDGIPTDITANYPAWRKVSDKVAAHPKTKAWNSIQRKSPKLKLTYFDVPGRAEAIRLTFYVGEVKFEDNRIPFNDFPALQPTLPFNQLPILQVDDKVISQSIPILRYAGVVAGLYPKNDIVQGLQIDEMVAQAYDVNNLYSLIRHTSDEDECKKLIDKLKSTTSVFDKRVAKISSPYAAGSELSIADMIIYTIVLLLSSGKVPGVLTEVLEPCKALLAVFELVKQLPKVLEWNSAHSNK